jgi:hypothetical protein
MSLHISVVEAAQFGVHVFGAPLTHCATVTAQTPLPQLWLPGLTFEQNPPVVPLQVPGTGSWQVL